MKIIFPYFFIFTAVIFLISSCAERINGIEVPPEPNATLNNSTISGIDSNKNGVRDDAERLIVQKYLSKNYTFPIRMAEARFFQNIITTTGDDLKNAIDEYYNFVCPRTYVSPVAPLVLNTKERKDIAIKAIHNAGIITDIPNSVTLIDCGATIRAKKYRQ